MPSLRLKLTFANAIALIALFVSLGGTVYAAAKIDGKTIEKESIPGNRLGADSVGGALVDEASLGPVPLVGTAQQAAKATEAGRAASVARADSAASAVAATAASTADLAKEAGRARVTDFAGRAENARALLGLPLSSYVRNCAEQTIKAAITVDLQNGNPVKGPNFNCAGGEPSVEKVRTGEYKVTFPKLEGGIPVATPLNRGTEVGVLLLGGGQFRVTVYGVAIERLLADDFSLAIF